MRTLLLKMLLRGAGQRVNIPVFGVVILLAFGVGLFWLVQVLLSNYLGGLTHSVLDMKEEIAVFKNPLYKNPDASESTKKSESDYSVRMRLDDAESTEAMTYLSRLGGLVTTPALKQSDFVFRKRDGKLQSVFSALLLGVQPSVSLTAFPVLDQLDSASLQGFAQDSDDLHPLLVSQGLLPGVKQGDVCELENAGKTWRFRVISLLQQDGIFSLPLCVVPLATAQQLTGRKTSDFIAVRAPKGDSWAQSQKIESLYKQDADNKFIVQHWSEALKVIYAVFQSINVVISAIVASLFIIAFFFSIALIDIVLKRRRKNIAMFLALGMQPKTIRNSVTLFGFLLGLGGFIGGLGLCLTFLTLLPHLPLAKVLTSVFISDFSFTFSWITAAIALFLSLATAVLSAWYSGRRVFRIDPIEDIRT